MKLIKTARLHQIVITTSFVTIAVLLIPSMASAETAVSHETLVTRSLALAPDHDHVITSTPGATVVDDGVSSVTLASAQSPVIRFIGVDGVSAGLALPPSHDVRVQALKGGAARAIVVIENESSPNEYSFDLQLPNNVEAMLESDGSVQFVPTTAASDQLRAQGIDASFNIGGLDIPWATDANGRDIATHYSIDGNTVIQHVDLASAKTFPVIADPKMTWKGFYATLKYSKAETRNMRDQGVVLGGMLIAAGSMAAFGPPGAAIGAVMVGIGTATIGVIAGTASNAVGDGKCLSLDVPSMYPTIVKC